MKEFKKGDKVIALTTPENELSQKRKRGKVYKVTDILICPKDNLQLLNIDDNKAVGKVSVIGCVCGEIHENKGLAWTHSDHFSKTDDVKEALDRAVENEDWDMAIALRDVNKV
jgi:hypothetical protein